MLEWRFNNEQTKNELSIVNFKAIGLLEVQNPNNTVHLLVPRLESTRGPRKNGDGEKYFYVKNSQEVEQISEHSWNKGW